MNQLKANKLQHLLHQCKIKIKELAPKIKESKRLEQLYNKYLIEKAVLEKQLNETKTGFLHKLFQQSRRKTPKLICDYFSS